MEMIRILMVVVMVVVVIGLKVKDKDTVHCFTRDDRDDTVRAQSRGNRSYLFIEVVFTD